VQRRVAHGAKLLIAARKRQGALVAAYDYFKSSNLRHFVLGQLFPSDFWLPASNWQKPDIHPLTRIRPAQYGLPEI